MWHAVFVCRCHHGKNCLRGRGLLLVRTQHPMSSCSVQLHAHVVAHSRSRATYCDCPVREMFGWEVHSARRLRTNDPRKWNRVQTLSSSLFFCSSAVPLGSPGATTTDCTVRVWCRVSICGDQKRGVSLQKRLWQKSAKRGSGACFVCDVFGVYRRRPKRERRQPCAPT